MKKSIAKMVIRLDIKCPYCGKENDLTDSDYEGNYLNDALSGNELRRSCVDCEECSETFEIESLAIY